MCMERREKWVVGSSVVFVVSGLETMPVFLFFFFPFLSPPPLRIDTFRFVGPIMLNRGRARVDQACTKTFSYGEEGQEVGQLLDSNLVEAKYRIC